jgi:hypothetical protein
MSGKEDIKDQIEELEESLRSIEKEVDAAITCEPQSNRESS